MIQTSGALALLLFLQLLRSGHSIGCYECLSGGQFPRDEKCEKGAYYATYNARCQPRDLLQGQQLATGHQTYCVKIIGTDKSSGTNGPVVMRGCSSTYRTECKDTIMFDDRQVSGCIYSCNNKGYCNSGSHVQLSVAVFAASLLMVFGLKIISETN